MASNDKSKIELIIEAVDKATKVITAVNGKVDKLAGSQDRSTRSAVKHERAQAKNSDTLKKVARRALAVAAAYISITAALAGVERAFTTVQTMDRVTQSLAAVTGEAGAEFEFLRKEADRLGVSLPKIAIEYSKITAAGRAAGISGQQIKDVFIAINEASVVLGLSGDDVHGTLRAIGQIMSKGTVQAEELKGQLGERLPGAFGLAAKAMGKTTQELGKLLETGDVTAEELLPKLAVQLQKTFSGQLPEASQRIARNVERVRNAVFLLTHQFSQPIADTLSPLIANLSKELNKLFDSGQLQQLGIRVAAFVTLVATTWNDGQIDELIALTIAAGFEQGLSAALVVLAGFVQRIPRLVVILGDLLVRITFTTARKIVDLLTSAFLKIKNIGERAFAQISNFIGESLGAAINALLVKLQRFINVAIGLAQFLQVPGADKLDQVDFGAVTFSSQVVPALESFEQIYKRVSENTLAAQEVILDKYVAIRDAVIDYAGLTALMGRQEQESTKELIRLLDEIIAKKQEAIGAAKGGSGANGENGDASVTPGGNASFLDELQTGFNESIDTFLEKIGTVAEQSQRMFTSIWSSITTGGAKAFQLLLGNTEYWSAKLGNIAGPVMGALTGAVAQFFAEWIAKRILVDGLETTLQAKQTAISVAQGAIKFAANLPGAIAAGISSFGAAAAIGTAAVVAALGAFSGAIKLADGEVNISGPGGPRDDLIPAWISNGESVINAPATRRNEPFLRYANEGGDLRDLVGSGSGGSTIYVVGSMAEARELKSDLTGEVRIRQLAREEIRKHRS